MHCGVVHVLMGRRDGCGDGEFLARGALQLCKSSAWAAVMGFTASPLSPWFSDRKENPTGEKQAVQV